MKRKTAAVWLVVVGVITVAGLLAPLGASPEVYGAVTGAIQAFSVTMALVIALLAQWGDSADRKVDRVLDLHRELTSGPTGEARTSLGWFYRHARTAGGLPTYTRAELKARSYEARRQDRVTPRMDADRILRFFERAEAARSRGSLDEPTAALLLGRHATWWDSAIRDDGETDPTRAPLRSMAAWAAQYVSEHPNHRGFKDWNVRTEQDFGDRPGGDDECP